APTLVRADHINSANILENLGGGANGGPGCLGRMLGAELRAETLRSTAGLTLPIAAARPTRAPPALGKLLQRVAPLRPACLAPLLVQKTHLHGVVAVTFLLPHQEHGTGTHL